MHKIDALTDLLKRVQLDNIDTVTLVNGEDAVTVEYEVPIDEKAGLNLSHQTTFYYSEETPQYLQDATKQFTEALLRAIQERVDVAGTIPCETCIAACCRHAWSVRVTAADVERLEKAGFIREDFLEVYDKNGVWTGHVGELRKKGGVENPVTGEEERVCIYLDERGWCGIHEHRPDVCRDYPAWDCDMKVEDPDKAAAKRAGKRSLPVI